MKKAWILIVIITVVILLGIVLLSNNRTEPIYFLWQDDGVNLYLIPETGEYQCFGCGVDSSGRGLCVDPGFPIPELVPETEERYCTEDFRIIEN
jgi:hypothetical protein